MKVALTGITGFVGMNLMPQLLALGSEYEFLTLNIDVQLVLANLNSSEPLSMHNPGKKMCFSGCRQT